MDNNDGDTPARGYKDYALSGKIMMSAMIILFFVVILMVFLHLYARWYLLRARRRQARRRSHFVFHVDSNNSATNGVTVTRGLDASVIGSLPVFVYSSKTHSDPIDCAVCLSEFEENEKGRSLPECNHSFHIDCIDMWFHSHTTCPLCRSPVEAGPAMETSIEVVISVDEPVANESGCSSELCSECEHEEFRMGKTHPSSSVGPSFRARRKPVSIEVPRRNESFGRVEDELGSDTPSTPSFKSPMSRVMSLSFKRILSRDKRGGPSPSGNGTSCRTVNELDVERGREEIQRTER